MKCPHCQVGVRIDFKSDVYQLNTFINDTFKAGISIDQGLCPECSQLVVLLREGEYRWIEDQAELRDVRKEITIFPQKSKRIVDTRIPEIYRNAYNEANSIANFSPKASAALSRRLLQKLLQNEYKIKKPNLSKEIDEFLKLPDIPSEISEAVDAIRVVGNFAAHPMKYKNTSEIVDVEPGEAEWLLEVLENLFDITFIQPEIQKERKARLNAKLQALGKQNLKT